MIAAWMLSAMLVGALVTAGAVVADTALTAMRRPTRFVWLAAMAVTLAWPPLAYVRESLAAGTTGETSAPVVAGVQRLTAIVVHASERSLHISADALLLDAWLLLSAALLLRMFFALRALRTRGEAWRPASVDGMNVRLSRDVGPAVVGFGPMEVVLPEWTLELEPHLRAIILTHEEEHRRARDPHLLLVGALFAVLVPWNLALWWQARRLRLAIELDCDRRVLHAYPSADRYGLLLLAIAQRRAAALSSFVPALSERTSNLERRIDAMRAPTRTQSRIRLTVLGAIAIGVIVIACSVEAPTEPVRKLALEPGSISLIEVRKDSAGIEREVVVPDSVVERIIAANRRAKLVRGRRMATTDSGVHVERASTVIEEKIPATVTKTVLGRPTTITVPADTIPIYAEFQVDKSAEWIRETGSPRYPPTLKTAGMEGEVQAQFTVDEYGRPDLRSFRVLRSNDSRFTEAVRTWLATARFTPAVLGRASVKQRVQQTFTFTQR